MVSFGMHGQALRREGSTPLVYKLVVVLLQDFGAWLFVPDDFAVPANAGNKSKQTMGSVKGERPHAIVDGDCQVGILEIQDVWRIRCKHILAHAGHGEALCGTKPVFRWYYNLCHRTTDMQSALSNFPQETGRHHIRNLKIAIIRYGEPR